jgi:hypothetical protein
MACSVLTTENFSIASKTLPAGGAGQVEGDQPLLAQPGVDEGRLADVGAAADGQPHRPVLVGQGLVLVLVVLAEEVLQRGLDQAAHALAVGRRDRVRIADAELVELGQQRRFLHALGLVGRQQHALVGAAQVARDVVVLGRQAGPDIDHEDHRIGLGHGLAGLLGHFLEDAGGRLGLEAAGVDDDELVLADLAVTVVAVAGQAGVVGHDRVAAAGESVEQGGLADVGSSDEGNDRFHDGLSCKRAATRALIRVGRRGRRPTW